MLLVLLLVLLHVLTAHADAPPPRSLSLLAVRS